VCGSMYMRPFGANAPPEYFARWLQSFKTRKSQQSIRSSLQKDLACRSGAIALVHVFRHTLRESTWER
jgi:hypothetical protein